MPGQVIYADDGGFPDGSRFEMIATVVPVSDDWPEGVKYRFHYMDANDGLLLRYDNFPYHQGVDRHHYHTPDGTFDDVEFEDLKSHVEKFETAVGAIQRGDDPHA